MSGETIAIDPTDGAITDAALKHYGWDLQQIWLTHHHGDHVGGVEWLRLEYGCDVLGNAADAHRLPPLNQLVGSGFVWNGLQVQVLELDGHTLGHIGYYISALNLLFAGDVIFSMGCGRVFEGTHLQAHQSLQKIANLPPQTLLAIAHEYTLDNAIFAVECEPNNDALRKRALDVRALRAAGKPTVPTLLELELATNPFLRASSAAEFKKLRLQKDNFNKS